MKVKNHWDSDSLLIAHCSLLSRRRAGVLRSSEITSWAYRGPVSGQNFIAEKSDVLAQGHRVILMAWVSVLRL